MRCASPLSYALYYKVDTLGGSIYFVGVWLPSKSPTTPVSSTVSLLRMSLAHNRAKRQNTKDRPK